MVDPQESRNCMPDFSAACMMIEGLHMVAVQHSRLNHGNASSLVVKVNHIAKSGPDTADLPPLLVIKKGVAEYTWYACDPSAVMLLSLTHPGTD